jgi:cytochrome c5
MRRLPRLRRHRHAGRPRSNFRQVAVGRWQPGCHPLHHRQRRAGAKQHPGAMPPMGGVTLSKDEVNAVAAYVWALGHRATR